MVLCAVRAVCALLIDDWAPLALLYLSVVVVALTQMNEAVVVVVAAGGGA